MGSIEARIRRLEESRHGGRCPECGFGPKNDRRPIAAVFPDKPDKGFEGDPYEACAACEEPLYVVIRVVYDSDVDEEEGGGDSYWHMHRHNAERRALQGYSYR